MSYLEKTYINFIKSHLLNVTENNGTYNFKCPFCGTHKKSKKAYLILGSKGYYFYCHKQCHNHSLSFPNFLKIIDSSLYAEFILEKYKNSNTSVVQVTNTKPPKKINKIKSIDNILIKCSSLEDTHPAKQYLIGRKIPLEKFDNLFYIDDIRILTSKLEKYKTTFKKKDSRILIPFFDRTNHLIALSGRSLEKAAKLRYCTIRLTDDESLVYNLNRVDYNKTVFVTEGPFDSMFFSNAVAVAGADFKKVANFLRKESTIFIFDNQPRNKNVISNYEKFCNLGYKVFIFPDKYSDCKDINDIILKDNISSTQLEELVIKNSFSKLKLLNLLNVYKKT